MVVAIQKIITLVIRPLSKLAYAEEFEGDAERRTAAYSSVREDSSTASTYKLPADCRQPPRLPYAGSLVYCPLNLL
ncbi:MULTISPECIES: palindromic element RPE1 domain-containing protein [unclassified Candidatus Tisiphia]|uniref:palindromic element RPE1 domain-containing protein n=1 Tax=unclassified Candidatus Tisiphia TaxID=2996318 RepID=UPI003CCA76F2